MIGKNKDGGYFHDVAQQSRNEEAAWELKEFVRLHGFSANGPICAQYKGHVFRINGCRAVKPMDKQIRTGYRELWKERLGRGVTDVRKVKK